MGRGTPTAGRGRPGQLIYLHSSVYTNWPDLYLNMITMTRDFGDLFTAAKNDAFVGAESWVRVQDLFAAAVCGGQRRVKRRFSVVPRVYGKTPMIKRTGLVWVPSFFFF